VLAYVNKFPNHHLPIIFVILKRDRVSK